MLYFVSFRRVGSTALLFFSLNITTRRSISHYNIFFMSGKHDLLEFFSNHCTAGTLCEEIYLIYHLNIEYFKIFNQILSAFAGKNIKLFSCLCKLRGKYHFVFTIYVYSREYFYFFLK